MNLTNFFKLDWILIVSVFLLLAVGLLAIYSIAIDDHWGMNNIFIKQLVFAFLGILVMILFFSVDYHYYKSYAKVAYFLAIIILTAVLLWGITVRGTLGWINFGFFNFQPVEIVKLLLIVVLASFVSRKKNNLDEVAIIIASLILTLILVFLVIKQPDFGSAIILGGIWLGMIIISGISFRYLLAIFLAGLILAGAGWFLLADYQQERILSFVFQQSDPQGSGYNVIQSMTAVGSGGIFGKGIGHGSQSRLNFLPENHTDFIFAAIAEEFGLVGSIFVISLFLFLLYRIKKIAQNAPDNFGYMLSAGIGFMFFSQAFINIGMNIGTVPVTGIPLPFLSYGGSSLLVVFISVGILLNIHNSAKVKRASLHSL